MAQLRAGMPEETVLIEVGENVGLAAANNVGMEYALSHDADWILLFNNDATVKRECLDRCLAEATATPGIAIVGPAVTFTDQPDLLWFGGGNVSDWFAYPRHPGLLQPAASPPPTSDVGYMAGCCALLSAEAFRSVGLFRRDFFLVYEDTEWCQRARVEGWRCRYWVRFCARTPSVLPQGQRGSLGLTENTAYYVGRNPLRFALETPQTLRRLTRVIGILVVYGAFNAWRVIESRQRAVAAAYIQGLADAFRGRMASDRRCTRGPSR